MQNNDSDSILDYRDRLSIAMDNVKGTRLQRFRRQPIRLLVAESLLLISKHLHIGIRCKAKMFWGGTMMVVFPEFMSNGIFRYGYCEPDMTVMLFEVLKPGMVFFDIGAHFGYATLLASMLVGERGSVHSFEPTSSTFEVLQANTRDIKNVQAMNMAVYSSKQILAFYDLGLRRSSLNSFFDPRMDKSSSEHLVKTVRQVQTISVDEYIKETSAIPNVVKIDAESAEYQILLGMQDTLSELKPNIIMEVGDFEVDGAVESLDLVKFLVDRQYDVFGYIDGRLVRQTLESVYAPGNRLFVPKTDLKCL